MQDPKLVISVDPGDPAARRFLRTDLPQLVVPHGGDYFFLPSMTALRMIGMGIVDPT